MTQSLVNRLIGSSQCKTLTCTAARATLALTAASLLLPVLVASQAVAGDNPSKKLPPQPTPRTLRPTPNGATTVKAVRTEGVEVKPRRKKTTKAVVKTAKPEPVVAKTVKTAKPTIAKATPVKRTKTSATKTETRTVRPRTTTSAPLASSRKSSRASRVQNVRTTRTRRTSVPTVRRSTQTLVKLAQPPIAPVIQAYPPYRKTVPPGSYVKTPARTDKAPYNQAITRPEILQRYQYAWKTSPQETVQRLKGLKLTQLPQGGVYRVYYTRANGAWGYKVRTVPAGTWVYSLPQTARPVMLQVCGNPVEPVPPALASNTPKPAPFSPLEPDTDLILDGGPAADLASAAFAQPGLPSVLGELSTPSIYSGLVGGVAPGLLGGGISSGFGFAIPLGVAGAAGIILRPRLPINGTVVGGQVINNVGPVPEPSGFVFAGTLLGTMGAALGRPLLAKRRRRQDA